MTLNERLYGKGPKKILSLDGGGVRGVLSLQILGKIEQEIRVKTGKNDAVLSDYFDLIGGTSTGAVIAAGLALGWKVEKIEVLYEAFANAVFKRNLLSIGLYRAKYTDKVLKSKLYEAFRDVTLGSDEFETGFAAVMKRLDTGSPWVVFNGSRGEYFDRKPGASNYPNRDYLIRDIVRASSAAPSYFQPTKMPVNVNSSGVDKYGVFVDGGVTPHNNPSLLLFMLATLSGYQFKWQIGEEKLHIVSVGTGRDRDLKTPRKLFQHSAARLGFHSLLDLMNDASDLNELLMQWLSTCQTGREIDGEIGDLSKDILGVSPSLSYVRYQPDLEESSLSENLGVTLNKKERKTIGKLDKAKNIGKLAEIGEKYAMHNVLSEHFPTV